MTDHHPIAIVGAGLGGLTAARVLHLGGARAAVFDLDVDRHARTQGGMLDIHADNGQLAIRSAGLWEAFTGLVHAGGEAMRILDHRATVLREELDDGELERPEVDRGQLRDVLLDSLPEGAVRWGRKVSGAVPLEGGGHRLDFTDGTAITTDLLIGADGAWSKVRALVSDARPTYTGVSFLEADLFDADRDHPAQAAVVGAGMLFALRDQVGILAHRESDGSLHVYLGARVAEDWVDALDAADPAGAQRIALGLLEGWDPALRGLVEHADTALTPRRISALPVGVSWPRTPGVTLLGDAAHVMSPFAGEGANLAMYDGSQLAEAVLAHPGDVEAALSAYERALFPRAAEAAAESASNLDVIFSAGSPRGLVEVFAAIDAQRDPDASATPVTSHDS